MERLDYISISDIIPNPYQPRQQFDPKKLEELAQSIQENGVIQPIIVRKSAIFGYELLAGERRWRASQLAGLKTIPVIIRQLSDEEMAYQAIIENLQRADLNPIEEAKSYQKLAQKGFTHDEMAKRVGKSRPYISNSIRLLQLPDNIQAALEKKQLSAGHARLLLPLSEPEQKKWLHILLTKEMSVRQLEKELAKTPHSSIQRASNPFLKEEEERLKQLLGCPVQIEQKKSGAGSIRISFQSLEELEQIIHTLH